MNDDRAATNVNRRRRRSVGVVVEALAVAGVGLALALLANQLSPRGLVLARDYFPKGASGSSGVRSSGVPHADTPATVARPTPTLSTNALESRLRAKNLAMIDTAQAETLFRDPRYGQELVVFVDARDDRHYAEGHVPGAFQLDHFYPERYLADVLPPCSTAERVVVYCNGSDCEDSESAAVLLREAGVPGDRLRVYAGGMTAWREKALPVEIGERNSGRTRAPSPETTP